MALDLQVTSAGQNIGVVHGWQSRLRAHCQSRVMKPPPMIQQSTLVRTLAGNAQVRKTEIPPETEIVRILFEALITVLSIVLV